MQTALLSAWVKGSFEESLLGYAEAVLGLDKARCAPVHGCCWAWFGVVCVFCTLNYMYIQALTQGVQDWLLSFYCLAKDKPQLALLFDKQGSWLVRGGKKGCLKRAALYPWLGSETWGLQKSPAVKSHINVACISNLQTSSVFEVTLRMCPFKLLLLDMVEIHACKTACCCTDQFICLESHMPQWDWNLKRKHKVFITLCIMKH